MEKSVIRMEVTKARNQISSAVDTLVKAVVEDSTTYTDALKKLKNARWDFSGAYAEMIIEDAIKKVERLAMAQSIKKDC